MPFLQGLKKTKLQKFMDRKKDRTLRSGGFASDESFDELLVLLRHQDIVISHKIIEHHFRPVFMLPFLAFPVVCCIRERHSEKRGRWKICIKHEKRKREEFIGRYGCLIRSQNPTA